MPYLKGLVFVIAIEMANIFQEGLASKQIFSIKYQHVTQL